MAAGRDISQVYAQKCIFRYNKIKYYTKTKNVIYVTKYFIKQFFNILSKF